MPEPRTILHHLIRNAAERPTQVAFRFLADAEAAPPVEWTWADLAAQVWSLADRLRAEARLGERVLLVYPEKAQAQFVRGFFASLAAGLVAVPVDAPASQRGAGRLTHLVPDCQPALALSVGEYGERLGRVAAGVPLPRLLYTDQVPAGTAPSHTPDPHPNDLAYLQYTSGSVRQPRGAKVSHANLLANTTTIGLNSGYGPDSVMVCWVPLFHDFGLVGGVCTPVRWAFSSTHFTPQAFFRDPLRWLRLVKRYRVTTTGAPNFAFDLCVKRAAASPLDPDEFDLSSLSVLKNGAEPVRAETLRQFTQQFAAFGFNTRAWLPCYGLAEHVLFVSGGPNSSGPRTLTVDSTELEFHGRVVPAPGGREIVSCGQIGQGVDAWVVSPASLQRLPDGCVGEVWVRSASVTGGYWTRPADAADDPFGATDAEGEGPFLRTGDMGFVSAGELFITGRLKDLIITGGRNVYPADIEATVEEELGLGPNCAAAFEAGEAGAVALAVATTPEQWRELEDGSTAADRAARVRQRLARDHGLTVGPVGFIHPTRFPRTSSYKVQRRAAADLIRTDSDDDVRVVSAVPASGPSPAVSPVDELLAWLREPDSWGLDSRRAERRGFGPRVFSEFADRGVFGLEVPRELGGLGLRPSEVVRVLQQLAATDLTLAVLVGNHNGLGVRPLLEFAAPRVRDMCVPELAHGRAFAAFALSEPEAGSDPSRIRSIARRVPGGWRLTGDKRWIGLAEWATWITVIAQAEQDGQPLGPTAFLVRRDSLGVDVGEDIECLGLRASVRNPVSLRGVFVPDDHVLGRTGEGLDRVARGPMNFCRFGLAALSLGVMKRCAQLAVGYAESRQVATGRLLDNPVTLGRLGALTSQVASLESLVRWVGGEMDSGRQVAREFSYVCKAVGPELAGRAVDQLLQLMGGRGYEEAGGVPQLYRDVRVLRIFEGPTESMLMALGHSVLFGGRPPAQAAGVLLEPFTGRREALATATRALTALGAQTDPNGRQLASYRAGEVVAAAVLAAAAPSGPSGFWPRGELNRLVELFEREAVERPQSGPTAVELSRHIAQYFTDIGRPPHREAASSTGGIPTPPLGFGSVSTEREETAMQAVVRAALPPEVRGLGLDDSLSRHGLGSLAFSETLAAVEQHTGRWLADERRGALDTIRQIAAEAELASEPAWSERGKRRATVIREITSEADRQAVFRFRYQVYVEELGRSQSSTDHSGRRLTDPLDAWGRVLAAYDHTGNVVGTVRVNCLRDGVATVLEALYGLNTLSPEQRAKVSISTRIMVHREYRRGPLPTDLAVAACELAVRAGVRTDYADCNPDRLSFFRSLGYRDVARAQHPDYGEVIVLRLDAEDTDHLAKMKSPLLTSFG